MKREIAVVIPAAGKGTRLHTSGNTLPKALHKVCERPMLEIVLDEVSFVPRENTYIVIGYRGDQIREYFGENYRYVEQKEQLGTAHAVMVCKDALKDFDGIVMVTFADMPLFRKEIMAAMCEKLEEEDAACVLLTAENPLLTMWARVLRNGDGTFKMIREGKDCSEEERKTKELFAGVIIFDSGKLFETLPKVSNENVQKEYYLTEVPELMAKAGLLVETYPTDDADDLMGVNGPEDIPLCEAVMRKRKNQEMLDTSKKKVLQS